MGTQLTQNLENCQEFRLNEASERPTAVDRALNFSLRMLSALRRRVVSGPHGGQHQQVELGAKGSGTEESSVNPPGREKRFFKAGDLVEILPWTELEQTLDANYCTRGLAFMHGMKRFCGRRVRVFKKVRNFYDEKREKMVRIRDSYILEEILCDGRDAFDKEGCDKSCFYFWKDAWLRKIPE